MKYLCYLLLPLVFFFQSCSTDDDTADPQTAEYFFRFQVDQKPVEYVYKTGYQINMTGVYQHNAEIGQYAINIGGYNDITEPLLNSLVFFASDTKGISTGVNYCNIPGKGDDFPDTVFTLGYYDDAGNLYLAGGAGDNPSFGLYRPAYVEFSEIGDGSISGIFSGTLLRYDNSGGTNQLVDSVVVSKGEFKVPRAKAP